MSAADTSRENWPMRAYNAEAEAKRWKGITLALHGIIIGMAVALGIVAGQRDEARAERDRAYDIAYDAAATLKDMNTEYQQVARDLDVCQTYVLWSKP